MDALLEKFIPMVGFLADILGDTAEVVLHDMSDIDESVIAIRNGHISGRKIGAPVTDLVLKILKGSQYSDRNFLTNYAGRSWDNKPLKSSTFLIRNEEKKIVGLLCVNIDIENCLKLRDLLDSFLPLTNTRQDETVAMEHFSQSVEELTFASIDAAIKESGVVPSRMHKNEKLSVIRKLSDGGIFVLKGAVRETAARLEISEASVYRYLSQLKNDEE